MRDIYFLLVLVALSGVLFFSGLKSVSLTEPDETFYAETAREMLHASEWSTPLIFEKPQFEKPVLYYWLVITSYKLFGVNEFAARFPSAFLGVIGTVGVYLLGYLLFSSLCGFLSGIILATCLEYWLLAHACVTDMALTVFILFGFLFFLMGWLHEKRIYYLLASAMVALAVLTKGPIGLLIPGGSIVLYIFCSRQFKKMREIPFVSSILVFLIVALPWYVLMTIRHGNAFLDQFFGFYNVSRFLDSEHEIGSFFLFYVPVIVGGFFPWSIFLPWAVKDLHVSKNTASRLKAQNLFLWIWFLVVFLFFSICQTKLVTYILPLFPVMAVVVGRLWEKLIVEENPSAHLREFLRGRKSLSFFSLVAFVMLFIIFPARLYIIPYVEKHQSSKEFAFKVKELAKPDEIVGGEDDHRGGIAFYTGRTNIVDVHHIKNLEKFMLDKNRVWGIVKIKHFSNLEKMYPGKFPSPLFQAGKWALITNKEMDEIHE